MTRKFATGALALTLTMCVLGCSQSPKASGAVNEVVPGGSSMDDQIQFEFAVYLLPGASRVPQALLRQELASNFRNLKLVTEIPKEPREMVVSARLEMDVREKYAPPDLDSLKYTGAGLTSEQEQALQRADKALILSFAHPKEHVWDALRTANELIESLARKTNGLVWDEDARQIFSPDAWRKTRLASWKDKIPEVSSQMKVDIYQNGEFARAISLGMAKMGLPDVLVEAVPQSSVSEAGNLIDVFSQSLAEGAAFDGSGKYTLNLQQVKNGDAREAQAKSLKQNATSVAYLLLKKGKAEEGDPHNRLIELSAERYDGPDIQAKQDRMLSCFFGWEDSVRGIEHTDELLEASRRAKEKLPELHKAFTAGLEPGEYIEVKAPFRTIDDGHEWMWVEVTKWNGRRITGILNNEPDKVPGLRAGQIVEVNEDDVFDYIRRYADKHTEGNTSGEIISRMADERPIGAALKTAAGQANPRCTPR